MPLYEKPHKNHAKHLCSLVAEGTDLSDYMELVKNPKYICRFYGRAAAKETNLCDPMSL